MALYNPGGGGYSDTYDPGSNTPGVVDWSKLPGGTNPFAPSEKPVTTAPGTPSGGTSGTPYYGNINGPVPQGPPPPTTPTFTRTGGTGTPIDPSRLLPPLNGRSTDPSVIGKWIASWASMPGADPSLGKDPAYWTRRIIETGGLGPDNAQYWQDAGVGPNAFYLQPNRESGTGAQASTAPAASGTGGVFSDPATAAWEKALNALVAKLQGPAYTPEQQALIQTSVNEPIQQAQDATHQALIRNLAGRGITPTSGIAQDQAAQIDRYYQQQKDLAARGFATNAINLGNQNQLQAVDYLKQVPQYADTRLQLALQTMAPQNVNPLSALNTYLNQSNASDLQTQQFWQAIGMGLAQIDWKKLFG